MDEKTRGEALREDDPQRHGIFTTGIVSVADGYSIALFFTGPRHAGENLREVLLRRATGLPPPTQMCDALDRNVPKDLEVILSNCLSHGRRRFVDLVDLFPEEVTYILEALKQVYQVEAEAKQENLSAEERLHLHQQRSAPVMAELHRWLEAQFDQKKVEPNGALGQAIAYLLRHWQKLTLFLRVPGAPLGRVEVWRGGLGFGLLLCQGFPVCGAISACHAPFPHPAPRTGRAAFPHPALLQNLRPFRL